MNWRSIRIKYLLDEVDERSATGSERLHSLSKQNGVQPRIIGSKGASQAESYVGYKRFSAGDIVMNKMQAWNGVFGLAYSSGITSPDYAVFRPRRLMVEPRFLVELLRTPSLAAVFSGLSRGMGTAFNRLNTDAFGGVLVSLPSLDDQRRIANFLDAEIPRIDQIVSLRKRQAELISNRRWSYFERLATECRPPEIPVRRILQSINDGPFGSAFSSSDYVEDGAVVVRLGNIGFDEYRSSDQARIPMEMYYSFLRYQVKPGDVLIAALGDPVNHAGRACVAPDLGPAIVKGKSLCARVDVRVAEARYLSMVLSSNIGRQSISTRGSTRSMINIEIIKSAVVPVPSLQKQREIVRLVDESKVQDGSLLSMVERQINLLVERRQALITAAVTGQFDVTTVRSDVR